MELTLFASFDAFLRAGTYIANKIRSEIFHNEKDQIKINWLLETITITFAPEELALRKFFKIERPVAAKKKKERERRLYHMTSRLKHWNVAYLNI